MVMMDVVGMKDNNNNNNNIDNINPSPFDCLLFDLDDTLYPLSSGIALACRRNIIEYLVNKFDLESEKASELCIELYRNHGTTMAGLVARGYKIDFDHYHSFVHGRMPYNVLRPDPALRSMILSMPQRKWIFTNADIIHAHKVLKKLGLEDCFEGIICFETIMGFLDLNQSLTTINIDVDDPIIEISEKAASELVICKPSLEAMRRAIALAGVDPSRTLFLDDSARNIAAGKAAGLHTVLVGSSTKVEGADYAIESIHNLREAVPHIWNEQEMMFPSNTLPMEAIVVTA